MPKVNGMFIKSKGYAHWIDGMKFDGSLQKEPVMDKGFMGVEMTGIFSPDIEGGDLKPNEFEMNNTDAVVPVHDTSLEDRDDLEFFLH